MGRNVESDTLLIARPAGDIYNFLADFNNFSSLLPPEVANWEASADYCSFEIKGFTTLGMRIIERVPGEKVVMKGEGKIPFDFSLICNIHQKDATSSFVKLVMETSMNTFMAMMAEKPLANFVDLLAGRLKEVMETPS